jgi:hypothetical protein
MIPWIGDRPIAMQHSTEKRGHTTMTQARFELTNLDGHKIIESINLSVPNRVREQSISVFHVIDNDI